MRRILISLAILVGVFVSGCYQQGHYLVIKTADPSLSIGIPLIQPEAPVDKPEIVPEEEVGVVEPDPIPDPPCELIKGNISTRTGEKIYHVPNGANYDQVKIDEEAGEKFFCSEEEATEAGWRKASR